MAVGATTQANSSVFLARLKAPFGALQGALRALLGALDKRLGPLVEKLSSFFSWLGKLGNKLGWGVALATVGGTWLKTGTFNPKGFATIDTGVGAKLSEVGGETAGPLLSNALGTAQHLMAQTLQSLLPEKFASYVDNLGWSGLTTVVQTLAPVAEYTPASALVILGAGAVHQTLATEQEKRAKAAQDNKVQVNG